MTETVQSIVPRVALLGVCDRLSWERNFDPRLARLNILRLRSEVVSHIYPLPLRGLHILLAVHDFTSLKGGELICKEPTGAEQFRIRIEAERLTQEEVPPPPGSATEFRTDPLVPWTIFGSPWPDIYPIMVAPGKLHFRWLEDEHDAAVGRIHFLHAPAPPLTAERITAIQSDPRASKSVRMTLACKLCSGKLLTYAGLERSEKAEAEGFIWNRDLPEKFECTCGKSAFSLTILRDNMHAYLGERVYQSEEEIMFTQVYEPGALQTIYDQLIYLLDKDPKEEKVQKFFEANTVLLQQFSPAKISFKPPTLTKFADFAVLSKNGQLRLVELERPGKKILRKDGGRTAGFTQACDQVLTWQHEFRDHRIAILEKLNLTNAEVTKVSGVVIMGRDQGYDRRDLLRLKSADLGDIEFFTYDDVIRNLGSLILELRQL